MKLVYFVMVHFLIVQTLGRSIKNVLDGRFSQYHWNVSMQYLKTICEKNSNSTGFNNIMENYEASVKCIQRFGMFSDATKQENFDRIDNCMENFIKSLEDCLTNDEKYYPSLVMDGMKSLISYIYDRRDKLHDQTINTQITLCFTTLIMDINKEAVDNCIKESRGNGTYDYYIPPKKESCRIVKQLANCLDQIVVNTCQYDQEPQLNDLIKGLMEAGLKPCDEKEEHGLSKNSV